MIISHIPPNVLPTLSRLRRSARGSVRKRITGSIKCVRIFPHVKFVYLFIFLLFLLLFPLQNVTCYVPSCSRGLWYSQLSQGDARVEAGLLLFFAGLTTLMLAAAGKSCFQKHKQRRSTWVSDGSIFEPLDVLLPETSLQMQPSSGSNQ